MEKLRSSLREVASRLCVDCQRRVETNPLRVLDCKVPEDQTIIDQLPTILDLNPLQVASPDALKTIKVLGTVMGGKAFPASAGR